MSQTAWEIAMGMRGYAGSPAQAEDIQACQFPDPYPMERWQKDEWERFHPVADALEAHGYWISSTPLEGQFDEWLEGKKDALRTIKKQAEWERKTFGYRGLSKNLLAALHQSCPEPVWGVEVKPSLRKH